MTQQIETPPHRKNSDWYKVKYRLASTLTNRAFTTTSRSPRKLGYTRARKEVDELLRACWSTLEPLPLERLLGRDKEVREFVATAVLTAALDLKALIELGLQEGPGEDEGLSLRTVNRSLRKGRTVSPLTIVEAIVAENEDPGVALMLDLACFFNQTEDKARAARYAQGALAKVPAANRERLRDRAADDPMLATIPGISNGEEKRRCNWPKRDPDVPEEPKRSWF